VPGGWAEFQDYDFNIYSRDGSLKMDSNFAKWHYGLMDIARELGLESSPGPKLHQWMCDAGFQNVTTRKFSFPLGPWAKDRRLKELGMINLVQFLDGLEAFSLRFLVEVKRWTKEDVFETLEKVRVDLLNRKIHMQFDL